MIGNSPQIKNLLRLVEKVARADSTVLITGESGTGKELVARAIHKCSPRRHCAFVPVNCGAIPSELLESELFGYEKGAFTGANRTKPGRFEIADGGSIFLDEIGDMGPELQVKVLRVLQERAFERVGGIKEIRIDARIIAATNKDLEKAVQEGRFREDLFYRLNVIPIRVPPLRERKGDIPLLAEHFLKHFTASSGTKKLKFAPSAMDLLIQYHWPGNVRELENTIERLVVLAEGETITPKDLPSRILNGAKRNIEKDAQNETDESAPPHQCEMRLPDGGICLPEFIRDIERQFIAQALEQTNQVKSKAAKLLGLKRTTLIEKMKKLGMV